jgi:hypothetical protein
MIIKKKKIILNDEVKGFLSVIEKENNYSSKNNYEREFNK